MRYQCRAAGANSDVGDINAILYPRPDSFFVHRPYDGGVQLGTGGPQHGAQAIRQSKKYIRYQSGKGITTKGNNGWGVKIQDLFDGKHPKYPHYKLQERVVRDGYLKQECSNCGYDDYREKDMRGPYLICFLDGNPKNHELDNLHLLCYNCFFIMKPTGRMLTTPQNVTLLRKKLEEVWDETTDE
mgnify:CR=1 FL=1